MRMSTRVWISVSGAGGKSSTFAWVLASMIQAWSSLSPVRYDGSA